MNRIESLVRKNIRDLIPYSSARDEFSGREGIFLDANENPFGKLNRYPDPHHRKLKKEISRYRGIPEENIFLGNGSDEIIDLVFRIFCDPGKDRALTFTPSYGMYEVSAAINDTGIVKVPLTPEFDIDLNSAMITLNDSSLKVVFICSPNNPTGNNFSREKIRAIIENFKGIVVIDEAYIDFSGKKSFISLVPAYENLVVMQTFSKSLGAAAIRVGMAFAGADIIRYFYRTKPPYNISQLNQREALKRISESSKFIKQVRLIISQRIKLSKSLSKLGITEYVYPSDSNFILVKVKDAGLIYRILTEKKIIVRNRSSVAENCLRITVGKPSENKKLLKALSKISL
jgi:histidinol-phosphate aminotransferase